MRQPPTTQPHFFTWRRFRVSLADSQNDREQVMRLRYEVFRQEWQGQGADGESDADAFDPRCEHLMIRDSVGGELIGTYRFNPGSAASDFYTATEFVLGDFACLPGALVELGRACLRKDWRNNMAMIALGRAIAWYANTRGVDWFFGCSSLMAPTAHDAALLACWFADHGHILERAQPVRPVPAKRLPGFSEAVAAIDSWGPADEARVQELMAPLLRFYLAAGAKVAFEPSYDPEFGCVDFFTALDWKGANAAFVRRYC
ncbi:MAG: GNAT family N-acetyltransferase [Planctomycetota bacterium]